MIISVLIIAAKVGIGSNNAYIVYLGLILMIFEHMHFEIETVGEVSWAAIALN